MSDEMMVQNQRPSAVPYLLGGAAVGGIGAGVLAKKANFGFQGQYAENAEDAIAKAKQEIIDKTNADDRFVTKMAKKDNEAAKSWKVIQDQAQAVRDAEKKAEDFAGDLKDSQELKDYLKKMESVEKDEKSMLDKLVKGTEKVGPDDAKKTLAELLKEDEGVAKNVLDEVKEKGPDALKDKKFKINGTEGKALKDMAPEDLKNMTEEEFKAFKDNAEVKKFLEKSEKFKEFAQKQTIFTKIRENATSDIEKLEEAITKKKEGFNLSEYKSLREKIAEAKNKAGKEITDDVLKKCKSAKVGLTATVGAIILALGALLLRPKAKDNAA